MSVLICYFTVSVCKHFCVHKRVSYYNVSVCIWSVFVCIFMMCENVFLCVCVCVCGQALCISVCVFPPAMLPFMLVYVRLRPLTHVPPLRGPRWLRWVSTHGVHGLDHSGCRGDIGRLLLQAVGLFVDRLYLDVWLTEGDTAATWKKNTTSGHILGRSQDELLIYWTIPDKKKQLKQQQQFHLFNAVLVCLVSSIICLVSFTFSPLILVH